MVTSTQSGNAKLFRTCQDIPWQGACKNVMRNPFFNTATSFTTSFLPNDKSTMVWSHGILRSKILAFKNDPRFDCQYESEIYTFQVCDVCALLALQQIVENGKMRLYIVFNCRNISKNETKKWELRIKVFLKHLKYVRKYTLHFVMCNIYGYSFLLSGQKFIGL